MILSKKAIEKGNVEHLRVLLESSNIDVILEKLNTLFVMCEKNKADIARVLIADPRINPHHRLMMSLIKDCNDWACNNGVEDALLLLKNPQFNPGYQLVNWSLENQQLEVIKQILIHPNLKDGNRILIQACQKGLVDVVDIVLVHAKDKIDIHVDEDIVFKLACGNGHADCVKKLIENGVDPSTQNNYGILYAGNAKVASLLLSYPNVNPTPDHPHGLDALILASFHGKLEVVKVLLQCNFVNPMALMGACVCWAHKNGHLDVVNELLADPRINPKRHTNYDDWFACDSRLKHMNGIGNTEGIKIEICNPEDIFDKK